jgi:uncharacterized protein
MKPTDTTFQPESDISKTLLLLAALIGAAVLFSYWPVTANSWSTFTTIFLGIFIEAVPFLLFGTLASGLVEVFLDQNIIEKITPKSPLFSALAGSLMGLFFPVCECGVVPLVRRLFRKGLPIPAGIAFLLAAPVINPIVILSTVTAFGFGKVIFMRIGFTFLIAVISGLVFSVAKTPWDILRPTEWITAETSEEHEHECHSCQISEPTLKMKIRQVLLVTLDEFFEIGRYLVLGAVIAAAMQTFVPQSILLNIGNGPVISVLVMMVMAVLLSICSTVDAFVALGFTGAFSTGSILAFLIFGPMVDIKSILLFLRVLRPKSVLYLVIIPMLLTILVGISLNYFTA